MYLIIAILTIILIVYLFNFSSSNIKLIKKDDEVIDSTKFQIKIVPSWFSDEYVSFKYTKNGIIWHDIEGCSEDFLTHYSSMKAISYRANYNKSKETQFRYELDKWSTLEKIEQFHKNEKEEVKSNNEQLLKDQKERELKKKQFFS